MATDGDTKHVVVSTPQAWLCGVPDLSSDLDDPDQFKTEIDAFATPAVVLFFTDKRTTRRAGAQTINFHHAIHSSFIGRRFNGISPQC